MRWFVRRFKKFKIILRVFEKKEVVPIENLLEKGGIFKR